MTAMWKGASDAHKVVLLVFAVLGLVLLGAGVRRSPGGGPKVPAEAAENLNFWYSPLERPVVGPEQHIGGFIFTPHRYPRLCGGELTVLMHRGWSTMGLPHEDDMAWLARPPGEVDL